jgi:hypothetical protein
VLQSALNGLPMAVGLQLESGRALLMEWSGQSLQAFTIQETMENPMKRFTADQVKIGFIGLGNMGSRIAQRLLDHGYQLSVYDRVLGKAEAIAVQGAVVPKNMLELARTSDVLLSCLTNDEAVRSVYTGSEGFFAGARSGTVVLEMITISPESSRELHRLGARGGVEVLWMSPSRAALLGRGRHVEAVGRRQPRTVSGR